MILPIKNFDKPIYNACYRGNCYQLNILNSEIDRAIKEGVWENRPFQASISTLQDEWGSVDLHTSISMQKNYHIKRIATIIHQNIWKEPIIVYNDQKTLVDGGHRLFANYYLNQKEISAIIINISPRLSDVCLDTIWKSANRINGNVLKVMKLLKIEILHE